MEANGVWTLPSDVSYAQRFMAGLAGVGHLVFEGEEERGAWSRRRMVLDGFNGCDELDYTDIPVDQVRVLSGFQSSAAYYAQQPSVPIGLKMDGQEMPLQGESLAVLDKSVILSAQYLQRMTGNVVSLTD